MTTPNREELEKIVWNEKTKKVLNEIYDICDDLNKRYTLELKPKIKELELEIVQSLSKLELDDNKLVMSFIGELILSKIVKDGRDRLLAIGLRQLIAETLDKEHLRIVFSSLRSMDVPEQSSVFTEQVLSGPIALKGKFPEHFGVRNFQEIAQQYHDSLNRIEKQAKQYGIPLPYVVNSLPDEKKEKIRLHPASISADEKIRLAEVKGIKQLIQLKNQDDSEIESLKDYHFVSEDFDTETELMLIREAIHSTRKPCSDDKWQRDWEEWCDILENYHEQGGTYASSKSAVDSTIIDEKTGKPRQRKITKEQIDASHDEYLNEMRFMITNIRKGGMFGRGGSFRKLREGETKNILDKIAFYETKIDGVPTGEKHIEVDKFMLLKEHLAPQEDRFNPTVRAIIDEMRLLINENPELKQRYKEFREKERAFRATRAIELHEILSEAA